MPAGETKSQPRFQDASAGLTGDEAALTQPIGLLPDLGELLQHVLGDDGGLAGVHHVGHAVDGVVEGGQLHVAGRVRHEGMGRVELGSEHREGRWV